MRSEVWMWKEVGFGPMRRLDVAVKSDVEDLLANVRRWRVWMEDGLLARLPCVRNVP
jgi:hypothetical protein